MNLQNTRTYLAGPVERVDDCTSWRDRLTPKLKKMGVTVWSPMVKPQWFAEGCGCELTVQQQRDDKDFIRKSLNISGYRSDKRFTRNEYVRDVCLRLVSACDFVICFVGGPTVGTFEEITIAGQQGKPVLFLSDGEPLDSCWRAAQFFGDDLSWFESEDDLINHLQAINDGIKSVNNIDWIFLPGRWTS